MFPRKDIHKHTWVSHKNIEAKLTMYNNFKNCNIYVRTLRGADMDPNISNQSLINGCVDHFKAKEDG